MEIANYQEKRSFAIQSRGFDKETRIINFSFATEEPVQRLYGFEVLSCRSEDVDMTRILNGAPLLRNHNPAEHVGVITNAWIDPDKTLRASALISRNEPDIWADIEDGILCKTSVGYETTKLLKTVENRDGTKTFHWAFRPLEVSLVALPADNKCGIGRAQADANGRSEPTIELKENRKMETVEKKNDAQEIAKLAAEHKQIELGNKAIAEGANVEQFRGMLLDEIKKTSTSATRQVKFDEKEMKEYSLLGAINAMLPGSGISNSYEIEVSNEIARKLGKGARGMYVPHQAIMKRDVTAAASTGAIYATNPNNDFVSALKSRLVSAELGVKVLGGIQGTIAIPKITTATSATWISSEGGSVSEVSPVIGQLTATEHTCGAYFDVTRTLLKTSSIDVQNLLVDDLQKTLAVAIDTAIMSGAGSSGEPEGIFTISGTGAPTTTADAPTWAQILNYEGTIESNNGITGNLKWAFAPNSAALLCGTSCDTGSGRYLADIVSRTCAGRPFVVSGCVPTKKIILGNWEEIVLCLFGALDLITDPYTGVAAGTVRVCGMQSTDVLIRNVKSFAKGTVIT